MTQRPGSVVSSQSLPIAKVITQGEQNSQQTANVFIHTPIAAVPRRTSPGKHIIVVYLFSTRSFFIFMDFFFNCYYVYFSKS